MQNEVAHTLWSFGPQPVMDKTWDLEAKHPGLNLNPPCTGQADVGQTCISVSPVSNVVVPFPSWRCGKDSGQCGMPSTVTGSAHAL